MAIYPGIAELFQCGGGDEGTVQLNLRRLKIISSSTSFKEPKLVRQLVKRKSLS